jgi:aryl-alcohol dehydrogenase-like predicted oxidoreductase
MKTRQIGRTGIKVSPLALGTMGWGSQLDTRPAHAQIDLALDHGINLIDTSEIYPIDPIRPETRGRTERIIGLWLDKGTRNRSDVILSTKQAGPGLRHVRGGAPMNGDSVRQAVEGSLRRLRTDYIDLFQFHWPGRRSARIGERRSTPRQTAEEVTDNMADCLHALEAEQRRGTIRAFGVCNETAWGVARWRDLAQGRDIHGPVSIQNEYSLLCRGFETDLAELCLYDRISLIASAPLASGLLTGKYQDRVIPNGSRMERMPDLNGRAGARAFGAVDGYLEVARKHGLDPVHMALGWVLARPFVASAVFGASSTDQIRHILEAADTVLPKDVLADIEQVYRDRARPF